MQLPKILILTALGCEYLAVRAHITNITEKKHNSAGTIYERGLFKGEESDWDVWIVETGAGNQTAAMEVERGIQFVNPQITFFVGVAGGVKDVSLGDVVVATKVYDYERGKDKKQGFIPRPDLFTANYRLLQRAKTEARKDEWIAGLNIPTEERPKVLLGPIATGGRVVAFDKSSTAQLISETYSETLAVEMEGHGHMLSAHSNEIPALVIRGISDLLKNKSQSDEAGWQIQASNNAAAFAFTLLAKLDSKHTSDREPLILTWEIIHAILNDLNRAIEDQFSPDVVITMSGPGSFAACYCMSLNSRNIPVLVAVTFPKNSAPQPGLLFFRKAATESDWLRIETSKWEVHLPNLVKQMPKGTKILIFDDRIISGDTQRIVKAGLEELGFVTKCAAMLSDAEASKYLDWKGMEVENDYYLPWGSKQGRFVPGS